MESQLDGKILVFQPLDHDTEKADIFFACVVYIISLIRSYEASKHYRLVIGDLNITKPYLNGAYNNYDACIFKNMLLVSLPISFFLLCFTEKKLSSHTQHKNTDRQTSTDTHKHSHIRINTHTHSRHTYTKTQIDKKVQAHT